MIPLKLLPSLSTVSISLTTDFKTIWIHGWHYVNSSGIHKIGYLKVKTVKNYKIFFKGAQNLPLDLFHSFLTNV